ncbi:MAG TPA: ATP-binding cassette domain-containing protein [Drouetiella sp.]
MTVQVSHLTKHFYDPKRGDFAAVNDMSFTCEKGEILGLLGPNGAGKTTTLRMIGTILTPDSGKITVEGFDSQTAPEDVRRCLGFLSAETGLYERLTPREILTYFAQLSRYPAEKVSGRVDEVIKMLTIDSFADTRCEKLSTGMKQKVSIARAVVHDPPVIILDEPTSGLDVLAIQSMHQFIQLCKTNQKCVLLSTHIMSEAEKLCDRIAIVYKGTIFALGTLEELRTKTNQHYLEDIFLAIVQDAVSEFV